MKTIGYALAMATEIATFGLAGKTKPAPKKEKPANSDGANSPATAQERAPRKVDFSV